jgi:hypothetical protein
MNPGKYDKLFYSPSKISWYVNRMRSTSGTMKNNRIKAGKALGNPRTIPSGLGPT